ncbi:unnamed protein product [Rotaria magnacalcarata]|uniref:TIR domain-containing protein n=5 Tax=Rotaria magnacalcarata TaxID=392030 RepID=A0A816FRX0_9BILA|nr:unnamed protein product [Rotaria magnacalcarata]CAF2095600.1 unnamed protein product [Rotaria magnacalcarata]CAF4589033.1 unnamed protein product [Rotaria magnacalcarata]
MSGEIISAQNPLVNDELIENLKSLSVSQSLTTYTDGIRKLHMQLKHATQNGLSNNIPFAFSMAANLYRIVPLLDKLLSNDDKDGYNNFIETKTFLDTLAHAFENVCFFEIFAMAKATIPIQSIFHKYIFLLKENYFTDDDKYDGLVNCLLPIISYASILTRITEDQIPADLLNYLLKFTKRHWLSQHREKVIKNILGLIKCCSINPALIPMVIRHEWPHACVQWLGNKDSGTGQRPSYTIDYYICLIIQKMARHANCVEILNQLNCLKRLDECKELMKKAHTDSEYNCLHLLFGMIYALLMESDEIKQLSVSNNERMCQVINEIVLYTLEACRNERFFYKCFHVAEMLGVLSKLFVNDDILLKFVNEDNQLFDFLSQLLIDFNNITRDTSRTHQPVNDETLLTLTNLLWSISFHECYHEKFEKNATLMNVVSDLSTATSLSVTTQMKLMPRDMCSLKKAAEGILWNLKPASSPSSCQISDEKTQQPLAMISYSHSNTTFCRELVENLSAHVPVWVDYKQAKDAVAHSDDLWEEIARAMELATAIVLIVSKEYYNSKSCRQELSYASDALKKRIIPIYPGDQQYRASGWLGIRIAGQKYIHFGRKPFAEAIEELSSVILTDQKLNIVTLTQPTVTSSSSCATHPIKMIDEENKLLSAMKNWTTKDIRKWFEDNQIHKDLITLLIDQFHTGTALIVYARHLKLFYRNEYIRIFKNYLKIFHGKKMNTFDFIQFVDALYRLRSDYDPDSTIEDSYEKQSEQQLPPTIKCTNDPITRL